MMLLKKLKAEAEGGRLADFLTGIFFSLSHKRQVSPFYKITPIFKTQSASTSIVDIF